MANDQFQIPNSPEHSLHEALRIADSFTYTPELQPEAFQFIKDIEARIQEYRDTAVTLEAKNVPWRRALRSYVRSPKSPIERLVEKEAVIGGGLFKKAPTVSHQRFWFHDEHRGKGDWFFESIDINRQATTLQFQTTSSTIEKLKDGAPVPFSDGELEALMEVPALYEAAIVKDIYGKKDHYDLTA